MIDEMIQKINEPDNAQTHMPFLTTGIDDQLVCFFCKADATKSNSITFQKLWKIWCIEGDAPFQINTSLPPHYMECAPTAWYDGNLWHLSFIAGDEYGGGPLQLYKMSGPSLSDLGQAISIREGRSGFASETYTVGSGGLNFVFVKRVGSPQVDLELPGAFIGRLAYQADRVNRILIGGQWETEREVFTLEYDLVTKKQSFLYCDGRPAYKPSVFGNTILYVLRSSRYPGDRQIKIAKTFKRTSFQGIRERPPGSHHADFLTRPNTTLCGGCFGSVDNGPAVRPSCLECVEKHVGAAYVLLTEEADGYAHRLRAIGHLHEAEDESQAWPIVHTAVRKSRKAYQMQGTMPGWDILEQQIVACRQRILDGAET